MCCAPLGPEGAIDLVLARTLRHSLEHLRFEARRSVPLMAADVVELDCVNPGRWQHIAGVYASLGLVPAGHQRYARSRAR
jgi:hypothetical protein